MEQLFKKFNIRPCRVILERQNFDEYRNSKSDVYDEGKHKIYNNYHQCYNLCFKNI